MEINQSRSDRRKELAEKEAFTQKYYDWICDGMRELELAPQTVLIWPVAAGIGLLLALPLIFRLESIHAEQAELDS